MREPDSVPLLDAALARAGDTAAVEAGDTWAALMERAAGHLARGIVTAGSHGSGSGHGSGAGHGSHHGTGHVSGAGSGSGSGHGSGYGLKVTIVVGKGNNGGDGWAAARRLREWGAVAWVVAPDGLDVELSDEAEAHRSAWIASGGRTSAGPHDVEVALAWGEVAVDALLGTGTRGAPRGPAADAVAALRRAHAAGTTVVACDGPSGVSADDGDAEPGTAVVADLTVTFGGMKRGLLLHPGAAHAGRVVVGDLGERYDPGPCAWAALTPQGAAPVPLPADADKRARGVVLTVAGAVGTAGAAALASEGALRAGAGLVTTAVPEAVRTDVAAAVDPGVMVRPLPSDENGAVGPDAIYALPDLAGVDAVVAGPGLGHGRGATELVRALRATSTSLVLDADALNLHRDAPDELAEHRGPLVLTPHERELARIGGGDDGPDAWAKRVERVPQLASDLDATIVVKGPGTMVVAPDGRVWVCPLGGPALGSGGTGDVLSGIVGAAVATADDVPLAVARAVWWHAAAGERVGRRTGGRGTATDLLVELPQVLADLVDLVDLADLADPAVRRGGRAASAQVGVGAWRGGRAASVQRSSPGGLPWESWRAWELAARHEGSEAR